MHYQTIRDIPVEKPKKKFSFLKFLLVFVLVITLLAAGGTFFAYSYYQKAITTPNSDDKSTVTFQITSGTTSQEIGKILKEKGLIQNELVWQAYVKLNKPNFLADKYELPKNLNIIQISQVLVTGQEDKVVWVTLAEGLRADETQATIAKAMQNANAVNYKTSEFEELVKSPDDFLATSSTSAAKYINTVKPKGKSLEGFLFPDTYAFRTDADARTVLNVLLENFMKKTSSITPANGLSFYENLTIASIVERESSSVDYSGVASVFLKRLEIREKLGSDITVLYILKRWHPEPTSAELLINSPYNTRKNYGIPPTPITSPGVAVIIATAQAKPGTDLFFLADANGKVHYGKNITEHERNICKYITLTCQ